MIIMFMTSSLLWSLYSNGRALIEINGYKSDLEFILERYRNEQKIMEFKNQVAYDNRRSRVEDHRSQTLEDKRLNAWSIHTKDTITDYPLVDEINLVYQKINIENTLYSQLFSFCGFFCSATTIFSSYNDHNLYLGDRIGFYSNPVCGYTVSINGELMPAGRGMSFTVKKATSYDISMNLAQINPNTAEIEDVEISKMILD